MKNDIYMCCTVYNILQIHHTTHYVLLNRREMSRVVQYIEVHVHIVLIQQSPSNPLPCHMNNQLIRVFYDMFTCQS